jgi:tRNA isopentenyl-2-thiomethyl-A-37 hydroxylase MiaE
MHSTDDNPVSLAALEKLHRQIEEQAAGSHWAEVEALMQARNRMLADIPAGDREAALKAAQKSTDRLLSLASSARLELAGELAKLQRGRKATDIYRANR